MNGITLDHLDKLYYSIGEVAELLEINASNIRYWEKEFPKLKPKKSTRGNRKFTKEDILLLAAIKELVKDKGFTIEGARKKLQATKKDEVIAQREVVEKLTYIKGELQKILRTMKAE